ncbi:MAG: hypothetical protein AC479_08110 [miscellaneous Crenarchaeota group-6 archaeon AD8-1]|nr:MAG: hypothetical protein AC479_08110 [miscellaneous Crenarchaeota group-6 archaeon AD8-1]
MITLTNIKYVIIILPVLLLISSIVVYGFLAKDNSIEVFGDVFVGVDVAYENMEANKKRIDEISSYTNLFVLGCTGITHNETKLNELCQYAYDRGLSFIVYTERALQHQWVEQAKTWWGEKFLGFYFWDENAGFQIDLSLWLPVMQADNYTDAANKFVNAMKASWGRMNYSNFEDRPLFTSDYALYWFDYKVGYDVVLTQFGWNYSRQLNVALCRGAANVMNKDWGAIITYTYTEPPYLGSGEQLFDDMILAYENGAKYIVVFDSDKNYTQGILKEEHFKALKDFKQYTIENPRENEYNQDRVALVLPQGYGYGFRGPNDKIWGLWEADALSFELSQRIGDLLEQYDKKLDIIYDENLELDSKYKKYILWNNTSYVP